MLRDKIKSIDIMSYILISCTSSPHTSYTFKLREILAPPQQYALDGENATLNCTTNFPNAFITWLREEDNNNTVDIGDGIIGDVSLEDEGMYICQDFIGQI